MNSPPNSLLGPEAKPTYQALRGCRQPVAGYQRSTCFSLFEGPQRFPGPLQEEAGFEPKRRMEVPSSLEMMRGSRTGCKLNGNVPYIGGPQQRPHNPHCGDPKPPNICLCKTIPSSSRFPYTMDPKSLEPQLLSSEKSSYPDPWEDLESRTPLRVPRNYPIVV